MWCPSSARPRDERDRKHNCHLRTGEYWRRSNGVEKAPKFMHRERFCIGFGCSGSTNAWARARRTIVMPGRLDALAVSVLGQARAGKKSLFALDAMEIADTTDAQQAQSARVQDLS